MKRHWLRPLVVLAVLALLTACGGGTAPPSGAAAPSGSGPSQPAADGVDRSRLSRELNVFNWTEYMPQEVLEKFEEEYGVRVNYDTYSSNEEMLAKIQAGGHQYDLVVPSDYMVEVMIKQGLLEPLDKANIPNLKNIAPEHLNLYFDPGNQYTVPYMWGTTALVYNTKYVQEPVDSWRVLWDPRYRGRVVLSDDARSVVGIGLAVLGYSMNETDPAKLAAAKAELLKLVPHVKAYDSDSPKDKLLSEEVWLGQVWNGEAALVMQEADHFRYVIPKEGASIWMDNLAIPKGAPHKYTAEVFINFLLRPDVAKMLGEAFPYGLPNAEGYKLLPEEIRQNTAAYPPKEWLQRTEWLKDVGEATELYDKIYTEIKGE